MAKLKLDLPEERVKTAFKLKKSSFHILNDYAAYLSEVHKTKVSHDVILDSLLDKLSKDKDFTKFRAASSPKTNALKASTGKSIKQSAIDMVSQN